MRSNITTVITVETDSRKEKVQTLLTKFSHVAKFEIIPQCFEFENHRQDHHESSSSFSIYSSGMTQHLRISADHGHFQRYQYPTGQ